LAGTAGIVSDHPAVPPVTVPKTAPVIVYSTLVGTVGVLPSDVAKYNSTRSCALPSLPRTESMNGVLQVPPVFVVVPGSTTNVYSLAYVGVVDALG